MTWHDEVTKRVSFPRRTKATAPPDTESTTETIQDTTTLRTSTRRGNSKFKTRTKDSKKDTKEVADKKEKDDGAKIENRTRQPSLNGGLKRSERPTRTYVRRRVGGANPNATASPSSTTALPGPSTTRRPFRVTSRRRPLLATSAPSTAASTASVTTDASSAAAVNTSASQSTSAATLPTIASEESLQELDDRESLEEPTLKTRNASLKKTVKIQRRPLNSFREAQVDQNPSATNEERKGQPKVLTSKEEDRKRQSKKYSSSFKQNQLDEVLRQKTKSQEEFDDTTVGAGDDYSAETAVAIAAHQLFSAPLPPPGPSDYDEPKPQKKPTNSYATTQQYQHSSPDYTTVFEENFTARKRTGYPSTPNPLYPSSTPLYRTTSFDGNEAFSSPIPGYASTNLPASEFTKILGYPSTLLPVSGYTAGSSKSTFSTPDPRQRPSGFTAAGFSLHPALGPSTARYLEASNKYEETPIGDYGYTNGGGLSREPSYFTREYLLESPVTKTYDDEYQYLSPVTTTSPPATKKLPKKTVYRKISTTIRPTLAPVSSTPIPRRKPERKPFEKVKAATKPAAVRTYRPIENYDYYDDSQEKLVGNYQDDTKVVLHGKGNIECLDIGNFPHPASCKKFISCARMEGGAIIGWEYVCPQGLSFDPVGGICNWSAGLGCDEH